MPAAAVETHGLARHFGTVHAVQDLDLSVPRGTVYGFLGPNGAGKTTTLHLLLGLLKPTSGAARVLDRDPTADGDAVRRQCGALLEHHGLYERLDAVTNLEFHARIHNVPPDERGTRIRTLLEDLDLWDRKDQPVGTWSRGMKQKLAIARALLHRPSLVFLDEPTAGQDPAGAVAFREAVVRLVRRDGVTVFLTTHNLDEAERVCDRVAVIRAGRLVAEGTPDDLRGRGRAPRLEILGRDFNAKVLAALRRRRDVASCTVHEGRLVLELVGDADAAPIVKAAVSAGAGVEEVHRDRGRLEDVYLDLVREAGPA